MLGLVGAVDNLKKDYPHIVLAATSDKAIRAVHVAMASVTPTDRFLLEARYWNSVSLESAADQLGLSYAAVRLLHRNAAIRVGRHLCRHRLRRIHDQTAP